jgi:PPOX class probable F420-dependent enzyme
MTEAEARRRFASSRVARLATVDEHSRPHLVPIVFAVEADTVYSAVDDKPKRTTALRRLANVRVNPAVALLADGYDEDWTALWWVRGDGRGRILAPAEDEAVHAVTLLRARYRPYADRAPTGPVLAVSVTRWTGWSAAEGPHQR